MNKIIVKGGIVLAALLTLGTLQSCFQVQEALGCNNTGIFGCKDKPSEITQPEDTDLKRAPPGGRSQQVGDDRYLEGQEYPWSQSLDDCMAAGGTWTECFASLPPEIQQIEVRPVGPATGD